MNGARDQLLAGAGLAGDEDRGRRRRDLVDAFRDTAHRAGTADEIVDAAGLIELGAQLEVLGLQRVAQPLDLVVSDGVGDRHRQCPGDGLQSEQLGRRERGRGKTREGRGADEGAADHERNRGIGADSTDSHLELVLVPSVFREKVGADVRLAGECASHDGLVVLDDRPLRHCRGSADQFGAPEVLARRLAVAMFVPTDMCTEQVIAVGAERDQRDAVEGDNRRQDLGDRSQDALQRPLGADSLPGTEDQRVRHNERGRGGRHSITNITTNCVFAIY